MNIHEYQAKNLLRNSASPCQMAGRLSLREAATVAQQLGGPVWVVKSQIHAGGRGAGRFKERPGGKGGVASSNPSRSARQRRADAGQTLVTKQTGPVGKEVKARLCRGRLRHRRELYFRILMDRETSRVTVIASTEGGMDIEEVAEKTPEKIINVRSIRRRGCGLPCPKHRLRPGLEGKQVGRRSSLLRRCTRRSPNSTPVCRDQSAGGDRQRRCHRARRQDEFRRQRALPHPISQRCATRTRKIRPSSKPPSTN